MASAKVVAKRSTNGQPPTRDGQLLYWPPSVFRTFICAFVMGLLATPIVLFTTNFFWQGLSRRSGSSHLIPAKADVMASFSAWLKEDFDFNDAQDDESPILSQTAKEALDQLDRSYRSLRISAHLKDTRDAGDAEPIEEDERDAVFEEMRKQAREASQEPPPSRPKIALLFLTRGRLPHDHLWERFIQEDPDLLSVYIHPSPGFHYNSSTTRAPSFYGREIPSVNVGWGNMSVVDAERRLLAAALADRGNERFVLLSESCIPIRNLTYTHYYLFANNTKSYLDSFLDVQNRYNARMAPTVTPEGWRKGSQWFALTREHADLVVRDHKYYNVMKQYCKVDCPLGVRKPCRRFCAPDEHFVQVLLAVVGRENEIHRRSLSFANWWPVGRAHPRKYVVQEASRELISDLQSRTELWRPLEKESLNCGVIPRPGTNETMRRPCWVFARKFTPRSGRRIASFATEVIGLPPPPSR